MLFRGEMDIGDVYVLIEQWNHDSLYIFHLCDWYMQNSDICGILVRLLRCSQIR